MARVVENDSVREGEEEGYIEYRGDKECRPMIQIDDTMYARLFLFLSSLEASFSTLVLVGGNVYYESLKLSSEEMFSRLVRIIFERGTIPRLFRIPPIMSRLAMIRELFTYEL